MKRPKRMRVSLTNFFLVSNRRRLLSMIFHRFAEFSKQVKQKVSGTQLIIQNLEEEVTYTFTVRAQTIDFGPPVIGNVTTGPQEGSPSSPRDLSLAKTASSVDMSWENGASGKGPILGYYIECKKRGKIVAICFHFDEKNFSVKMN